MESQYVPVYKYAEKIGVSMQNVYRWIREGKLKEGIDYIIQKKEVKRKLVNINFKP